jgi:hypothetical protein
MKKAKRFQDGGITITPQASTPAPLPGLAGYGASTSTYPFQSDTGGTGTSSGSGVNQTFNIQPTASTGASEAAPFKKGGTVKKMAKGGSIKSSASRRGDGCATKGKTKGRFV